MKRIAVFILLVTVLFSCKKNDNKTCNQDMAGIAGTYKVTAATYRLSSGTPEQDVFNNSFYLDPCEKDDLTILSANGNLTYTDAGTKCSPAGDRTSTWSLSGSTITIEGKAFIIQSFSCTTLIVTTSDFATAGDQVKVTFTRQ
jgi:Lipocalin-like domain